jgi:hypothetical protein
VPGLQQAGGVLARPEVHQACAYIRRLLRQGTAMLRLCSVRMAIK